jgi:predicted aspartyl protease
MKSKIKSLSLLFRLGAILSFVIAATGNVSAQVTTNKENARQSLPISFLPISDMRSPTWKIDNHSGPVVRAYINGRSYWLVVDTGSSYSLLKQSMAQETKLPFEELPGLPKNPTAEMLERLKNRAKVVTVPEFGIGPVFLRRIPFIVISDNLLNPFIGDDPSLAGVIGENFLHIFAVYFDNEHKAITLFKQGDTTEQERKEIGFGPDTIAIPLQISPVDERKYMTDIVCNGKTVTVLVDTGASTTSIYKPSEEFGIQASETTEILTIIKGGQKVERSALAAISIGKSAPLKLKTEFGDGKDSTGKPILEYGDGLLGSDFLSQYYVLMDFPAKKMYLRPRNSK